MKHSLWCKQGNVRACRHWWQVVYLRLKGYKIIPSATMKQLVAATAPVARLNMLSRRNQLTINSLEGALNVLLRASMVEQGPPGMNRCVFCQSTSSSSIEAITHSDDCPVNQAYKLIPPGALVVGRLNVKVARKRFKSDGEVRKVGGHGKET